jgi:hypothetical protein
MGRTGFESVTSSVSATGAGVVTLVSSLISHGIEVRRRSPLRAAVAVLARYTLAQAPLSRE